MTRAFLFSGSVAALVLSSTFARADKPADVLPANHLKVGTAAYVLDDETEVLDGMKTLRDDKKKVDADKRVRKGYDLKISAANATMAANEKEWEGLKDRLSVITDPTAHNRIVLRMNMLVVKAKEAARTRKEAEDKEAEMSVEPENQYVDALLSLGAKADAVSEKYKAMAADAAVKSAVDHSTPHLPLGPSKEFADAGTDLKKWETEVESEAIPMIEKGGVQTIVATVNGQQQTFILDVGSSMITLPGDLAEQLKIKVSDDDPVIHLKLADGNIIEGKRASLKSVRVGRFTIENVACVVLAKQLHDAPALLGNSFLSHFVVKIDQKAGKLNLVEVQEESTGAKSPSAGGSSPGAAAGSKGAGTEEK